MYRKLVELVGGPLDGNVIPIQAYAKTIAVPYGRGSHYRELIYQQNDRDPLRFDFDPSRS